MVSASTVSLVTSTEEWETEVVVNGSILDPFTLSRQEGSVGKTPGKSRH